MNSLESEVSALSTLADELLYLGIDDTPIYSDDFTRLNHEVFQKANALYHQRGSTFEEEASLCLALLPRNARPARAVDSFFMTSRPCPRIMTIRTP